MIQKRIYKAVRQIAFSRFARENAVFYENWYALWTNRRYKNDHDTRKYRGHIAWFRDLVIILCKDTQNRSKQKQICKEIISQLARENGIFTIHFIYIKNKLPVQKRPSHEGISRTYCLGYMGYIHGFHDYRRIKTSSDDSKFKISPLSWLNVEFCLNRC
jgi:hypothetical protein